MNHRRVLWVLPLLSASLGAAGDDPPSGGGAGRDALRPLPAGAVVLEGWIDDCLAKGIDRHLKAIDYRPMVDYFRHRPNPFAAGEFWGKTVRAASLSYRYRADARLKAILGETVADLLSTQTPDGCISARTYPEQPKSSDLWERKYVLLGLLGYYDLTGDDRVLQAMVRLADYTLGQVGPPPKTRIVDTGWAFEGIESSSILEPIVRLYQITGSRRYLDFARYIVETEGACKRGSLFEAALAGVPPREINANGDPRQSIAKAYESMSCFEGLAEYFRATGNQRWKQAVLSYYRALRDREITLLGSGGGEGPYNAGPGTGEQWNDLAREQSHPQPRLMMETCVTVTWMKFCEQVLRLTGDSTVADQIETSLYNALQGAQRPTGDYYDYFQNFNGTRDTKVNFTADIGRFPLSCCTANGPMGLALVPRVAAMESADGPVVNLFHPGTVRARSPGGGAVGLKLTTDYPRTGRVEIEVSPQRAERFALRIRVPAWSAKTSLRINGQAAQAKPGAYAVLDRVWSAGDRVTLELDMRCRLVRAPRGVERSGDPYVALVRGPLVLARDLRLGRDIHDAVAVVSDAEGFVAARSVPPGVAATVELEVPLKGGGAIRVIDYASAGNTWDAASEFRTWMRDAEAARPASAADGVPPPQAVGSGPYEVGVFMCPLWKTGAINGREWEALLPFPKRQPLLGWYDEGDPEVTDWEIKYLLEHGITFGITCWYREKGNAGRPVRPWLGHWLHDGLFKSRYGDRFRFALLWENVHPRAEGRTSKRDLLENLLPFWVENYFRRPNYLKVGGKPLLMIYGVARFIDDMGGEAGARGAIDAMRDYCRGQGLGGLTIIGECHHDLAGRLPRLSAAALDGAASYHWPTFSGLFPAPPDPGKIVAAQERCWRQLAGGALPCPVTVSVGWDSRPWNTNASNSRTWQLAPPHFAELCRRARAWADAQPASNPLGKMILIDNWNEFGEGHYIFPHREHGFAYLDAVRSVFSSAPQAHRDRVPEELGLGPYDRLFRSAGEPAAGTRAGIPWGHEAAR